MAKTWRLVNIQGSSSFMKGCMDVDWDQGSPVIVQAPAAGLEQRIAKAMVEPRGNNPFETRWGSNLRQFFGADSTTPPVEVASEIGLTLGDLATLDSEFTQRVPLQPGEQLIALRALSVTFANQSIYAEADLQTNGTPSKVVVEAVV